jgi:hypothetical protein
LSPADFEPPDSRADDADAFLPPEDSDAELPGGCSDQLLLVCLSALMGALGGAATGLIIAVPFWLLSGEPFILALCGGFFGIGGGLYLAGLTLTAALRQRLQLQDAHRPDRPGVPALAQAAALLSVCWSPLAGFLGALFSPHRAGRSRRTLFGAAAGGLIGSLFALLVWRILPPLGPQALSLLELTLCLAGGCALGGGLCGLCSTDW